MRVFALATFLVSASTLAACPTLTGTYKFCSSENGQIQSDMVVSQKIKAGAMVYTIEYTNDEGARETDTYIADGKTRTTVENDPEIGIQVTTAQTATCVGETVVADLKVTSQEGELANVKVVTTKTGARLTTTTNGNIFGETLNQTQVCE